MPFSQCPSNPRHILMRHVIPESEEMACKVSESIILKDSNWIGFLCFKRCILLELALPLKKIYANA